MLKHTELPWSIWSEGSDINPSVTVESESACKFIFQTVGSNDKANAAFIVKACNEREGLFELLNLIRDDLKMRADFDPEDGGAIINISGFIWDRLNETIDKDKEEE